MRTIVGASRWAVTAHFAALVVQFGLAIGLLAGKLDLSAHADNARVVACLAIVQVALLSSLGASAVGRHFVAAAALVVAVAIAQLRLAWGFTTTVHVSLALLYWGISLALLIKVWKPEWENI